MDSLATAFLYIIEEEQSTSSVETIRNKALEKIAAGEGKALVASSVNGKSFSFTLNTSAEKLFVACSAAIREYNNGLITTVVNDLSGL
jgi:hypothetical protein